MWCQAVFACCVSLVQAMFNRSYLVQLAQQLEDSFSTEELEDLCFRLEGVKYDNLQGRTLKSKTRALVEFLDRRGRVSDLVTICEVERPHVNWLYHAHVFIAYKRHATSDHELALYLRDQLTSAGHRVFIDQSLRSGEKWLDLIDRMLANSDHMILLLSEESVNSEMVRAEIRQAHEYLKKQGRPDILPIRVGYEGMLPYSVAAFVSSRQYIHWRSPSDHALVANEVLAAIERRSTTAKDGDFEPDYLLLEISEDGGCITDEQDKPAPLPEFDPRLLARLSPPGGAVRLRDRLYIERAADFDFREEILRWGSTVSIRGSRQSGKTSLLMRGLKHAREQELFTVFVDLQTIGEEQLATPDVFLQELARALFHGLDLDVSHVDRLWRSSHIPQSKLTYLIEDELLPKLDVPIVFAIDEADSILRSPFHTDFFGMIRSWHNRRAMSEEWEKFNIVLVISTEPYFLIRDQYQSPFNVGMRLELVDFNLTQVAHMNQQHGSPLDEQQLIEVMALINGQPYLTRKLLYVLVKQKQSWHEVKAICATDTGPFGDHLRNLGWILRDNAELRLALRQVIRVGQCDNETLLYRLQKAGLVIGSGDAYRCRCDLYEQYFSGLLS